MQRETNGVIVVDKPEHITSAKTVSIVKKGLKANKAGHAGTLDPFATGILVCCVNQATRLARFFLHGDKTYRAVLRLGVKTDTQDATGAITSVNERFNFTEKTIQTVFERFNGKSMQHPPVFSALKHNGTPLYKLARRGEFVQKPAREITISSIVILDIELPDIRFEVTCSGGTYLRTLCADIGDALGCGGHLKALRRIESSGFGESEAIPLAELKALSQTGQLFDRLIPMAEALRAIPAYTAGGTLVKKIAQGVKLTQKDFEAGPLGVENGFIKIVDENKNLCAVLDVGEKLRPYRYCCVFHS